MKTTLAVLCLSVAMVSPFAASAQEFSGAVTLGYAHRSIEISPPALEATTNSLTLDGRIEMKLDSGLTFGAKYNSFGLNVANLPADLSGSLIGLNVGYDVSESFSAGAFLETSQINAEIGGSTLTDIAGMRTIGIEGQYRTGNLEFGAFLAKNEVTGYIGTMIGAADVDVRSFGLSAQYDASSNLVVGGTFMRTTIDTAMLPGTPDIDYLGIAAVYGVNSTVNLFGGLSQTRQSDLDVKINTIAIGGSYDLTATSGFPLVASLELARTDLSVPGLPPAVDPKSNAIRLGLTMPLGKGTVKAPLNSTADAILNPSHDVLSQSLMNF